MLHEEDSTWYSADATLWSIVELNVGILATSIPSYKSIARRYAPRLLLGGGSCSGEEEGGQEGGGGRENRVNELSRESGRMDGQGRGRSQSRGSGEEGGEPGAVELWDLAKYRGKYLEGEEEEEEAAAECRGHEQRGRASSTLSANNSSEETLYAAKAWT